MTGIYKKVFLAVLTAALVFAAYPVPNVYAQDGNPPKGELAPIRLEQVWARELKAYERLGRVFADIDHTVARLQARLDLAARNGRDVTRLQAALDAFESALTSTRPAYEGMSGLVSAHLGFASNGKVVDAAQARTTVREVGLKLDEIKSSMGGTGRALHEALKAFRAARPVHLPTASDS
jgi:hypothetical protein